MKAGGLAGFRILDLTWHVAGPFCTKLLAGFGAEVIKVERPGVGDPARRFALASHQPVDAEKGSLFLHLGTGKKSITLDLKQAEGRRLFLELVRVSDAVIESFSPRVMPGLGLGYETLRSLHPSLVMTSISSFGQTGPYRDYRATDVVCLAMGGLLYLVGEPDREPLRPWGPQASYQAGLHAAVATLTALYQREETGVGEHVDVSVMESVAFQMHAYPQMYLHHGKIVRREGQMIAGHGPTGHYPDTTLPCQDGFIHVQSSAYQWEDLALLMEEPRLADPQLKAAQRTHAAEIDALMEPWLASHDKLEIFEQAQALRMPFAPVLTVGEVLRNEHLGQRGYFDEVSHPVAGLVRQPGPPARLSESPWTTSAAPLLGEHNQEIYGGLLGHDSGGPGRPSGRGRHPAATASQTPRRSPRLPLEGVRVLDLTHIAAGPYATQILADMGAELIKIEGTARYDRYRGPLRGRDREDYPPGGPGERPYNRGTRFNEVNRNKLGMALDLTKTQGVAIFKSLAAISDVVIENYSPRVMRNFGLDYPVLQALNPALIMVSMPGFGATGPYRNYVANGPAAEAMSGLQHLTGYVGGPPMKVSGWYSDQTNSLTVAYATLVALHHRRRTGRGQRVESAMLEAATLLVGEAIVEYAASGRSPDRMGNRHVRMAPHGCYRCAGEDAWVAIAVRSDAEWRRLCRAMGHPEWEGDERLATAEGRRRHEDELDRLIEAWTVERDHREVTWILQEAAVPAGAVLHPGEVMHDPHLRERGYFQEVVHPEAGAGLLPRVGWMFAGTPCPIRRPAPCFGEHNGHVLAELLGLPAEEIRALDEQAVISSRPLV